MKNEFKTQFYRKLIFHACSIGAPSADAADGIGVAIGTLDVGGAASSAFLRSSVSRSSSGGSLQMSEARRIPASTMHVGPT